MHAQRSKTSRPRPIACHRCGAAATVRSAKEYLCSRCAVSRIGVVTADLPVVLCDRCGRESLVRVRETFLCAGCAMDMLGPSVDEAGPTPPETAEAPEMPTEGEGASVADVDIAGLMREGAVRLVDAAEAYHAALARSVGRSREPADSEDRISASSLLFKVVAASFDARMARLELQNDVLARMSEGFERQIEEVGRERDELVRTLRRAEADRRWAVRRLVDAKEQERRRISMELHDDAVQTMIGVRMQLEAAKRTEPDGDRRAHLERLETATQHCVGRLRGLMADLRTDLVERQGLAAAIRQLLDRTAEEGGVSVTMEDRLTHEPETSARTNLYRIAQEALANVRKHARATRVVVTLEPREAGVSICVRDDGVGFQVEAAASREHVGLDAMRERTKLAGGTLRIESAPGDGTTVTAWVPARMHEVADPPSTTVGDHGGEPSGRERGP
jgi:signal transduction histidine kinase